MATRRNCPPIVVPRGYLQRRLQDIRRVVDQRENRLVSRVNREADNGDLYQNHSPSNRLSHMHGSDILRDNHPDNGGIHRHQSQSWNKRDTTRRRLDTTEGEERKSCLPGWTFLGGIIVGGLLIIAASFISPWFQPPIVVYNIVSSWGVQCPVPTSVRSTLDEKDIERKISIIAENVIQKLDLNSFTKAQVKEEVDSARSELKTYLETTAENYLSSMRTDLAASVKTAIHEEMTGLKKGLTIFTDNRIREALKNVKESLSASSET